MNNNEIKNEMNISQEASVSSLVNQTRITCGLIMPISAIGEYDKQHWADVKKILINTLNGSDFELKLVSDEDEANLIHNRIVTNVFSSDIVVCDVSANNPNVMFELGMRLAFDKSVVIIKDDKTQFSFDISIIDHLIYPRDLTMLGMQEFQREFLTALKATYAASIKPDYSSFLKHFSITKVKDIDEKTVGKDAYIIEKLNELSSSIANINRNQKLTSDGGAGFFDFSSLIEAIRNGGNIACQPNGIADLLLSRDIGEFLNGNDIAKFFKDNKINYHDIPDREIKVLFNTYFKASKEIHEHNPHHKLEPERIVINFLSQFELFLQ